MVVSCAEARKGQKGKKSGVRNKKNIMGANDGDNRFSLHHGLWDDISHNLSVS